jgi:hypothetical protein
MKSDILAIIIGLSLVYMASDIWRAFDDWSYRYAFQYGIDEKLVTVENKPHNCDWGFSPIGSKYCHYEKAVAVYNSEYQLVGGTEIEFQTTTTGVLISTYDEGKTWQVSKVSNLHPAHVTVTWGKVDD